MKDDTVWAGSSLIMLLGLIALVIFIMFPLLQPVLDGVHRLAAVLGN